MNRLLRTFFALLLCLSFGQAANASSMLPITTDRHVQISDAVFRGQILSLQSWQSPVDNHIYTTAAIRV
ncbi:MAG: hypothetical protein JWQ04_1582, partial [Pedosphaera sp.]|nr:hypothetical protein [Pedosphaera sp.]